jgi:hypothetical protein
MSGDKDTFQQPGDQPGDQQPETEGSTEDYTTQQYASPPPFSPPPSSAPFEFLDSQWMPISPAPLPAPLVVPRPAFAPPPPSAPGEFLSAQWVRDVTAVEDPPRPETDVFADALPETIENAGDLERLEVEPPGFDGSSAPIEREVETGEDRPVLIRGVPLSRDEEVVKVFLPNEGLASAVPQTGQAMILTSQRLIAFRGVEGFRDTHYALTSEISQCSVRTGQRNWAAVLQGLMIMSGGGFLYLVVGYWLAGRISGPNVPLLNIDVAPFITLLIILAGLLILLQNYFTRPAGAVIFHGVGVEIAFPFRSSLDLSQVYEFVDKTHAKRRQLDSEIP